MSGQIEVGKWAVIARGIPCCGKHHIAGFPLPFVVTEIATPIHEFECGICGHQHGRLPVAYGYGGNAGIGIVVMLLKRIDDPGEENSVDETHELETT